MKYILNDVNKRRLGFLVVVFAMRLDIAVNIKSSLPRGRAAAVVDIDRDSASLLAGQAGRVFLWNHRTTFLSIYPRQKT
jgi:hypothetical protein